MISNEIRCNHIYTKGKKKNTICDKKCDETMKCYLHKNTKNTDILTPITTTTSKLQIPTPIFQPLQIPTPIFQPLQIPTPIFQPQQLQIPTPKFQQFRPNTPSMMRDNNGCSYIFMRGENKGKYCNKKCNDNRCSIHLKSKSQNSTPIISQQSTPIKILQEMKSNYITIPSINNYINRIDINQIDIKQLPPPINNDNRPLPPPINNDKQLQQQNGINFEYKLHDRLIKEFDNDECIVGDASIKKYHNDQLINGIDHFLKISDYIFLIQDKIHVKKIDQSQINHFIKATEKIAEIYKATINNNMIKQYNILCLYVSVNGITKTSQSSLNNENIKHNNIKYLSLTNDTEEKLIDDIIAKIKNYPNELMKQSNPLNYKLLDKLSEKLTNINFECNIANNMLICNRNKYEISIKNNIFKSYNDGINYTFNNCIDKINKNIYLYILLINSNIDNNTYEKIDLYIKELNDNCNINSRYIMVNNDDKNSIIDNVIDYIKNYPSTIIDYINNNT
jgi:hypothetical protein